MEIEQLRNLVFADPVLTESLSKARTEMELIAMVQEQCGDLSVVALQQIMQANRRLWLERWLHR